MKKKSMAWIVTGGIIVIMGAGGIVYSLRGGDETEYAKEKEIKGAELVLTEDNLKVNHEFLGWQYDFASSMGIQFAYGDTQVEAKILGEDEEYVSCFRVIGDEGTQYVQQWNYEEQGKNVMEWMPVDIEKAEGDIQALEDKSVEDDHYISLILREENHIVGYVVLKIQANQEKIFKSVEVETAIEFPKQNGEYQKVTKEYVEEKIGKVMADKLS